MLDQTYDDLPCSPLATALKRPNSKKKADLSLLLISWDIQTCTDRNEGIEIGVPSTCSQSASGTPTSDFSRQISLPQLLNRRKKLGPSHPHAQRLNASLVKLLALQLLPFQLVDSAPFREFVECVVPQWQVPKRHFFSRKALYGSLPVCGRQCLGLFGQGGQQ